MPFFSLYIRLDRIVIVYVGVTLQMALLVSTVLSCLLSAGWLIVSVLSLLVPSAAARCSELLGNGLSIRKKMATFSCCVWTESIFFVCL